MHFICKILSSNQSQSWHHVWNPGFCCALQVTKKHHFSATALTFGKNKYNVVVNPNVDQAFVAAIVTIMDAIYEDNNEMWEEERTWRVACDGHWLDNLKCNNCRSCRVDSYCTCCSRPDLISTVMSIAVYQCLLPSTYISGGKLGHHSTSAVADCKVEWSGVEWSGVKKQRCVIEFWCT